MTATPATPAAAIALQPGEGEALLVSRRRSRTIKVIGRDHGRRVAVIEHLAPQGPGVAAARPPQRGRVVLRHRGRVHFLGRRPTTGRRRLVRLRPARRPAHLPRQLGPRRGSCWSSSRPLRGLRACPRRPRRAPGDPHRPRPHPRTWRRCSGSPPPTASRSWALRHSSVANGHTHDQRESGHEHPDAHGGGQQDRRLRSIDAFNARDEPGEAASRTADYIAHAPASIEPAPLDSDAWAGFLGIFLEGFPDLQVEVVDAVADEATGRATDPFFRHAHRCFPGPSTTNRQVPFRARDQPHGRRKGR